MKIEKGKLKENTGRDIYWGRINFISDDGLKKTQILVCASFEYFSTLFKKDKPEEVELNSWLDKVIDKWSVLGDEIFNQDVHYDIYATTPEGEANEREYLNYLIQETQ